MPTRSIPVESRSRRRPSGAGFRRTATQMALSRCAIAHRGADWYFWRGTPAIACVAAQPPCSWHLPEAGQATGGPCPALEAKWLHRHPVAPRNDDSDQARVSTRLLPDVLGVDQGLEGADPGVLRALRLGHRSPSVWPVPAGRRGESVPGAGVQKEAASPPRRRECRSPTADLQRQLGFPTPPSSCRTYMPTTFSPADRT